MEITAVTLSLQSPTGKSVGFLDINLLPSGSRTLPHPLLHSKGDEVDSGLPSVQLLESHEYRYELRLPERYRRVSCEPREMFHPDDASGRRGRLRTGLYTGTVVAVVRAGEETLGSTTFEVRSRKLDYLQHYAWMLEDIAEIAASMLMERFGPSIHSFRPEPSRDPETAYQQFAFLQSLITSERFRAAISYILENPHCNLVPYEESRPPGRGIPGSSRVARALVRSGPRIPWDDSPTSELPSLPRSISVHRWTEHFDVPETRFVRYVLEQWRAFAGLIHDALRKEKKSPAVKRGLLEATSILDRLDSYLAEPLLRSVGRITALPFQSQVLQRREGYRELLEMYLQFMAGAALAWPGGEDVYGAGKRDVAKLYEIWVYLQIVRLLSRFCKTFNLRRLFSVDQSSLQLSLRSGDEVVAEGTAERLGRRLKLEVWYNRTFSPGDDGAASWTTKMRPDISLRISPAEGDAPTFPEVWLHFDAKYRIEQLAENLGLADDGSPHDHEEEQLTARRVDLLKMHAYRDAIRRSVGSYVIYPGTDNLQWREYHELLPGLGAFALRPAKTDEAEGLEGLACFLDDVLTHIASQFTRHERARYWVREAYERGPGLTEPVPATPLIKAPPADVPVLMGYVRNQAHYYWIRSNGMYNLRADDRRGSVQLGGKELAAELVVLYGTALEGPEVWLVRGQPEIWTRSDMIAKHYPNPRGKAYICLPISRALAEHVSLRLDKQVVERLVEELRNGKPLGTPVVTSWFKFVAAHTARR